MPAEHEMMTAERIAELQKICDAATKGPWLYRPQEYDDWGVVRGGPDNYVVVVGRGGIYLDKDALDAHRVAKTDPAGPNAIFCAAARTAFPDALATIASLQAALAVAREGLDFYAHARVNSPTPGVIAKNCDDGAYARVTISRIDAALKGAHPAQGGE